MWYPSSVTVPPAVEPVTLDEAKQQCLVSHADDDALLTGLIKAARAHVEEYCNARFAEQTIVSACSSFADFSRLPEGPLRSVTSIEYVNVAGEVKDLDAAIYEEHKSGLEPSIGLKSGQIWPAIRVGSRITLTAIYGGAVPDSVKHAMRIFIDDAYHQRGNAKREDWAAINVMLCNHRRGA